MALPVNFLVSMVSMKNRGRSSQVALLVRQHSIDDLGPKRRLMLLRPRRQRGDQTSAFVAGNHCCPVKN
jgi:hypothetical protein